METKDPTSKQAKAIERRLMFNQSARHMKAAEPILKLTLLITCAIGFSAIPAGVLAIYKNAQSATQLSFLGLQMTTGAVGVALVALGCLSLVWIVRRMFKSLEVLGAIKD